MPLPTFAGPGRVGGTGEQHDQSAVSRDWRAGARGTGGTPTCQRTTCIEAPAKDNPYCPRHIRIVGGLALAGIVLAVLLLLAIIGEGFTPSGRSSECDEAGQEYYFDSDKGLNGEMRSCDRDFEREVDRIRRDTGD